ncbi:MAG: hypothetical protein HQL33_01700 [Alphaproteobacteria bacterium]|nr:hypothetical protein [Alphaproteobacteria bacterium]MBF0128684.1 hypothetical protein [Alphaproteobacteria bacterium]
MGARIGMKGLGGMIVAGVVLASAMAIRYLMIEPRDIGAACQVGLGPWWCDLRLVVVAVFQSGLLGGGSLLLGVLALALGGRGRVPATLAMVTGAAGLVLYNAGLASAGLLLGLITAARLRET